MIQVRIIKSTDGSTLVENCAITENLWERICGLLGHRSLPSGDGLWIEPCNSVHTLFMRFPIDVIFLDSNKKVLDVSECMKPWRFSPLYWRARSVLELPAGEAKLRNLHKGDQLGWEK